MFVLHTSHGAHYATEYASAATLEDTHRVMRHLQEHGCFPVVALSDVESRVRELLTSGKRPTKTQLRKALNGY